MFLNDSLKIFSGSPSVKAIDFAAETFPLFAPTPKFEDRRPLMRPVPIGGARAGCNALIDDALDQAWDGQIHEDDQGEQDQRDGRSLPIRFYKG